MQTKLFFETRRGASFVLYLSHSPDGAALVAGDVVLEMRAANGTVAYAKDDYVQLTRVLKTIIAAMENGLAGA